MANNLTLPHWDSNPRFLNKTFPPNIWSLREIRSIQLKEVKISRLYRSLFFYYRVIGQAANCIERSLGMKFSMENLKDTSFDENEDNSSGKYVSFCCNKVLGHKSITYVLHRGWVIIIWTGLVFIRFHLFDLLKNVTYDLDWWKNTKKYISL